MRATFPRLLAQVEVVMEADSTVACLTSVTEEEPGLLSWAQEEYFCSQPWTIVKWLGSAL